MGKFSDTRRHPSWTTMHTVKDVACIASVEASAENETVRNFQAVRMLVFTAARGENARFFTRYERKLKFNPGIAAELYESILESLPQGGVIPPGEDSMEIITSERWHAGPFSPEESENTVREAVQKYLEANEAGAMIKAGYMMVIESESCLVFSAFM